MFSEYQNSGWTTECSRSDRVCSQTHAPSNLLEGSPFIDKFLPDELHCILNETRVRNNPIKQKV